ncbi:MAG: magnesium/cobalt transporter CorA [Microcoleaceae cyanobacterium]
MAHSLSTASVLEDAPAVEEEESGLDYFYDEPGTLPGTLDLDPTDPPPELILIYYNQASATRILLNHPEDCLPYLADTKSVCWLDVQGLGNTDTWQRMSHVFQFHPVALEDVVNIPQRPKVVVYENPDHIVIVAQMVMLNSEEGIHREQVSLILGNNYLITVQEEPRFDCLQPVRDRIRSNQGAVRKYGADYLAYAILDAIIDGYFPVLEAYSDRLESLEEEVLFVSKPGTLEKIYETKRELLYLRRTIWSQREALYSLVRDKTNLVSKKTRVYLQDCYDHAVNVVDMLETYRELASDLTNLHLSSISNRMNEIMKLLTIVSAIFIPLTFIAGLYGMNFDPDTSPLNMPELNWYWGYPICIGIMILTAASLIFYFWKRGWFEDFSGVKPRNLAHKN